jgi:hypothetical protein
VAARSAPTLKSPDVPMRVSIQMAAEPLTIFDPRRKFQLQGFTGRGATTTIHDASATGVSVSGIFQAAEDFAVLRLTTRMTCWGI